VAADLEKWFDENEELQEQLERFMRRAWRTTVIKPLRHASGNSTALQEAAE
jgi:muconolactone delta-isomerase